MSESREMGGGGVGVGVKRGRHRRVPEFKHVFIEEFIGGVKGEGDGGAGCSWCLSEPLFS